MTGTPKTRKEIAEHGAAVKKIASKYMTVTEHVANKLQLLVEAYTYIDISKSAAQALGVSDTTLNVAIRRLEEQGLAKRFYIHTQQKKTEKLVAMRVLASPEKIWNEIYEHRADIHKIEDPAEKQRQKVAKSATYGLSLEEKLEKINQADIPETEKRSLRTIAKSEERAKQGMVADRLKIKGYSNVAIAKQLGVAESTVRRLLKPYEERDASIKVILSAGQEALENAREGILEYVTEFAEFAEIFRQGDTKAHILRIHTVERAVQVDPNKKRINFRLEFWADSVSDDNG